jgi:copper chaperone CopZ
MSHGGVYYKYGQQQAPEHILETYCYNIQMICEKCPPRISKKLQEMQGVKNFSLRVAEQDMVVTIDSNQISAQAVLGTLISSGEIASFKTSNQQRPHF